MFRAQGLWYRGFGLHFLEGVQFTVRLVMYGSVFMLLGLGPESHPLNS